MKRFYSILTVGALGICVAASLRALAQPAAPTDQPASDQMIQIVPVPDNSEPTASDTTEPTTEPTTPDSTATTEPTTEPTTGPAAKPWTRTRGRTGRTSLRWSGPASAPVVRAMTSDYGVLLTTSIFVKGHAADTSRSTPTTAPANPTIATAESALVFNGVTDANGSTDAYIEDTGSGQVTIVKVGDAMAKGKVTRISLESLDYEAGGKVTTVLLGQNLAGGATAASALPTSSPAPTGGAADILEQMRRRRLEQTGGR